VFGHTGEQDAEEGIWSLDWGSKRRLEKMA